MILLEMMGYDTGTIFIESYLYSDLIFRVTTIAGWESKLTASKA